MISPLPPAPTGIADYTMDVARAIRGGHEIELFHGQNEVEPEPSTPTFPIADWPGRHASKPFDALIYQMGNAPAHDFIYDWMERAPGVVVLHDLVLHHSYARRFLDSAEARAYASDPSSSEKREKVEAQQRAYVAAIEPVYPGLGERLKDAHFNSVGDILPYAFPLFEPALSRALAVGAHNRFMVAAIQRSRPDLPCHFVAMPVEPVPVSPQARHAFKERFGFADADRIVGAFGLMTREKQIETIARAVSRVAQIHPDIRLLLAGPVADRTWLGHLLEEAGVSRRTVITDRLDASDFATAMEISKVVVHLRYPTARETSAALLRVMAQRRPVVVSDLANQSEIPDDAVIRVDPCDEEGGVARAIDRLFRDPAAAQRLGDRAGLHVLAEHSDRRTLETYDRLLKSARPHYS